MLAYLWIAGDLRLATTKSNEHHTCMYSLLSHSNLLSVFYNINFGQDSLVATHDI